MRWPWNCMRKFLLLSLSLLLPALFLLIAWSGTTIIFAQQQPCYFHRERGLCVWSNFWVWAPTPAVRTWLLAFRPQQLPAEMSGTSFLVGLVLVQVAIPVLQDSASLTTGGNNSVITETAQWMTELLLTISSNPSGYWKHESQWELLGESGRISYRYAVRNTA